jgi:hypothetical protein
MFSKLKKALKSVVAAVVGGVCVIGAAMFLGVVGYAIGVVVCVGAALRLISHPINWVSGKHREKATIAAITDVFCVLLVGVLTSFAFPALMLGLVLLIQVNFLVNLVTYTKWKAAKDAAGEDDSFSSKMSDIVAEGVAKSMEKETEATTNATMDTVTGEVSSNEPRSSLDKGLDVFAESLGRNVAKEPNVSFETLTDPDRWGNHGNKPAAQ